MELLQRRESFTVIFEIIWNTFKGWACPAEKERRKKKRIYRHRVLISIPKGDLLAIDPHISLSLSLLHKYSTLASL